MSKKKTKSKACVTVEKHKDGTYNIEYKITDPEHLTYDEFMKLVEFVDQTLSEELEGF